MEARLSNPSPFGHSPYIRWTLRCTAALTFIFLYLPVTVLIVYSFNSASEFVFPPKGLSFVWYERLFQNEDMQQSITNSLTVAAAVVPLSLVLGTMTSFALDRFEFKGKAIAEQIVLFPLVIPRLITGLAILLVIKMLGMSLSLVTMIIGHTVAWLPLVVSQVHARLRRFDRRIEEASMDLGADRWQTFWRVTLPNIRTALIGSGLLVFTLSFDEIAVSFFLTGTANTLPMHVWSMLRTGITPEIAAIATLNIFVSLALLLIALKLMDPEID
jgi:spermidine/putrescine transport system permease protein